MTQFFIQGITADGKVFRPSDWADRLCGVMSPFRPGGATFDSHLSYSPYVLPIIIGDIRCVVIDDRLKHLELKAWDFLMEFAKDNDLVITQGCTIP